MKMSEQKTRMRCACSFIDITRSLDYINMHAHSKDPHWKMMSMTAEEIDGEIYETCFKFDADKRIAKLNDAIKNKDRKAVVKAVIGLREVEALCSEV